MTNLQFYMLITPARHNMKVFLALEVIDDVLLLTKVQTGNPFRNHLSPRHCEVASQFKQYFDMKAVEMALGLTPSPPAIT